MAEMEWGTVAATCTRKKPHPNYSETSNICKIFSPVHNEYVSLNRAKTLNRLFETALNKHGVGVS